MLPQAAAGPEIGPVMPMVISVSVTPGTGAAAAGDAATRQAERAAAKARMAMGNLRERGKRPLTYPKEPAIQTRSPKGRGSAPPMTRCIRPRRDEVWSPAMPPRLGVLLAVVFWGVSFVATKAVVREVSPTSLIFTRAGLGTLLLVTILWLRRKPALPPRDSL